MALAIVGAAFIATVISSHSSGTFPLVTLWRRWFPRAPTPTESLVAIGSGLFGPTVVPVVAVLSGAASFAAAIEPSERWLALALASVLVKVLLVLCEEMIFRGAFVSQLLRWCRPMPAVGLGALVFAVAHSDRSGMALAILFLDGFGFGMLFVLTRNLWPSCLWHLSKNLAVWGLLGGGTFQWVEGPVRYRQTMEGSFLGWEGSPGGGDVIATLITVALACWFFSRRSRFRS